MLCSPPHPVNIICNSPSDCNLWRTGLESHEKDPKEPPNHRLLGLSGNLCQLWGRFCQICAFCSPKGCRPNPQQHCCWYYSVPCWVEVGSDVQNVWNQWHWHGPFAAQMTYQPGGQKQRWCHQYPIGHCQAHGTKAFCGIQAALQILYILESREVEQEGYADDDEVFHDVTALAPGSVSSDEASPLWAELLRWQQLTVWRHNVWEDCSVTVQVTRRLAVQGVHSGFQLCHLVWKTKVSVRGENTPVVFRGWLAVRHDPSQPWAQNKVNEPLQELWRVYWHILTVPVLFRMVQDLDPYLTSANVHLKLL